MESYGSRVGPIAFCASQSPGVRTVPRIYEKCRWIVDLYQGLSAGLLGLDYINMYTARARGIRMF